MLASAAGADLPLAPNRDSSMKSRRGETITSDNDLSVLALLSQRSPWDDSSMGFSPSDRAALALMDSASANNIPGIQVAYARLVDAERRSHRIKNVLSRTLEMVTLEAALERAQKDANGSMDACSPLIETCGALLKLGADPNKACNTGTMPLHRAARAGCLPLMGVLLEGGADINAQSRQSSTPLRQALLGDHMDALCFLLRAGANPDHEGSGANSMLKISAFSGVYGQGDWLLLAYGASYDEFDGSALELRKKFSMEEASIMARDTERLLELLQAAGEGALSMLPSLRAFAQESLDANQAYTQEVVAVLDALQARCVMDAIRAANRPDTKPI